MNQAITSPEKEKQMFVFEVIGAAIMLTLATMFAKLGKGEPLAPMNSSEHFMSLVNAVPTLLS